MAFEVARVHGLIRSKIGGDAMHMAFSPSSGEYPSFPSEFNYDNMVTRQWSETPGSPLESSACSTETESDEDDELDLAGLAEQIAHSMLEDDEGSVFKSGSPKVDWSTAVQHSSQAQFQKAAMPPPLSWSTGSWISASAPSSESSSRVSSQVSSPPMTPLAAQTDAWDLLYAASGEVVRLKIGERQHTNLLFQTRVQRHQAQQQSLLAQMPAGLAGGHNAQHVYPGSPSAPTSPRPRFAQNLPHLQRSFSAGGQDDTRKASPNQNESPKAGQAGEWARHSRPGAATALQNGSRLGNKPGNAQHRSRRTVAETPPPHNVPGVNGGAGMRAVFLGAARRESCGTGVFLPRTPGSGADYNKRKPACSTVILPMRIVQVLNLSMEDVRSSPPSPRSPARSDLPTSVSSPLSSSRMRHEES